MIAIDTSSLRRFLSGESGPDVDAVATAIEARAAVLPPVVIAEVVGEAPELAEAIRHLPQLELHEGFWIRAGELRSKLRRFGHKARVERVLIAQSCIDHNIPLITNDADFRHYEAHGLLLLSSSD